MVFKASQSSRIVRSPLRPLRHCSGVSCRSAFTSAMAPSKSALIPVANGSEEMEAVILIDCLRRAGVDVTVASVEAEKEITASRSVRLVADKLIQECTGPYDCIALPGGMPGAERLRDSDRLIDLLQEQRAAGKLYAAICAAPAVVLEHHKMLDGKPATCHPAFVDGLSNSERVAERVVVEGNCVTSRGPGTAFEFALELIEKLLGAEKRVEVAGPMVMYNHQEPASS